MLHERTFSNQRQRTEERKYESEKGTKWLAQTLHKLVDMGLFRVFFYNLMLMTNLKVQKPKTSTTYIIIYVVEVLFFYFKYIIESFYYNRITQLYI
jgi:hypothetical protein